MGLERFSKMTVIGKQVAEVDPRGSVVRVDAETFPVGVGRLTITAKFLENDPQIDEVDRIRGIVLQRYLDPAKAFAGFSVLVKEQSKEMLRLPMRRIHREDRFIKRRRLTMSAILMKGEGFLELPRERIGI